MIAAFAYLLFNSARNRLQSQLRRLRTPRYAIAFALGLLYFWGFLGRNLVRIPRPAAGAPAGALADSPIATIAPVFVALVVAGIWIFGGDMSALAFSEAEVAMLMTAPVPRRALVIYKLAQSQFLILVNVLIWTFLLRRGSGALPGALSAASVWVIFTTLNLHRMGRALGRASSIEYRAAGRRRRYAARAFATAILVMIVFVILEPLRDLESPDSANPFAFLRNILHFLESPGVQTVLYPFRIVVAPSFARSVDAWALAMLPALGVVLLHVLWVLRSDAAFEEAAALASTAQATRIDAIRSRRTTLDPSSNAAGKTIPLAPTGLPIIAIVWKNATALRRTVKLSALLRLPILVFAGAAIIGSRSRDPALVVVITSLVMGIMLPLILSQVLRHDLRTDMMHLPLLKSLPLAGGDLVLAEVASSAVPMAALQLVLFAIAGVAFSMRTRVSPVPAGVLAGFAASSPLILLALNGAFCTIVNGAAVLFPAWIRLGPGGAGGVEMMGQAMLNVIASGIVFILMLLIPGGVGAGIWYLLGALPALATVLACAFGAAVLGAEIYVLIQAIGHAYERAEPQQAA